jgi:hypothetical protein
MAHPQAARRHARFAAKPQVGIETWITIIGPASAVPGGDEFHDCPFCRELEEIGASSARRASGASDAVATPLPGGVGAMILDFRPGSLPDLVRDSWIDDIVELVGRNATVRVMGRDMESEPVEVLSLESFLARLGYD